MPPRLVKKRKQGRDYWYLIESARVKGKPRVTSQRYLGPAERLPELLAEAHTPREARGRTMGPLCLWRLAERIGIRRQVDGLASGRQHALSAGEAVQLVACQRALPGSASTVSDWVAGSVLDREVRFGPEQVSAERLWQALDRLDEDAIELSEERIARRLIEELGPAVGAELLCLDPGNSFGYAGPEAERGAPRKRRQDPQQVSLALLVTREHGLPLFSEVYAADGPTLARIASRLERRARLLGDRRVTLVLDKGSWSADLAESLREAPYGFIAALDAARDPEALWVSPERFYALEGIEGTRAYRSSVGEQQRTLVLYHSVERRRADRRGLREALQKATRELSEIKLVLEAGVARPKRSELEEKIEEITSPRWVDRVLKTHIEGDRKSLKLRYGTDLTELRTLERELFGKIPLLTTRDDWSDEAILSAYRIHGRVHRSLERLRSPELLTAGPSFEWTGRRVRVHLLCCVLALLLQRLLWREVMAADGGASPERVLDELRDLTEVELVFPAAGGGRGRPRVVRTVVTPASALGRRLVDAFDLAERG